MTYSEIEEWAAGLLTVAVVAKDGEESSVWHCLHHLFSGVKMYDNLSVEERKKAEIVMELTKHMFCTKISLKERKRQRKEKKNPPQPPSYKVKEKTKEKADKKSVGVLRTREMEQQEAEIAERKAGAVTREEYLRMKAEGKI